jgi:hypothetical protein
MDWGDLAKQVIGLGAPVLGAALGGPLGGVAGKILADALGAEPVPAEIGKAIEADPFAAQAAVQNAEAEWAKALAEIAKTQVAQVGETMRAEASSEDALQRWWRPLYALELTLIECPGFAAVLGHALWSGRADLINGLANLSGLLMTYMAARFGVLGVYVTGRSREKQALATGEAVPTVFGVALKKIKRNN